MIGQFIHHPSSESSSAAISAALSKVLLHSPLFLSAPACYSLYLCRFVIFSLLPLEGPANIVVQRWSDSSVCGLFGQSSQIPRPLPHLPPGNSLPSLCVALLCFSYKRVSRGWTGRGALYTFTTFQLETTFLSSGL